MEDLSWLLAWDVCMVNALFDGPVIAFFEILNDVSGFSDFTFLDFADLH